MSKLSAIIVDTFIMGTIRGDFFMELQTIFQNYMGDMGCTKPEHISGSALAHLSDRGFIATDYNHNGHFRGYKPSDKALSCMFLQLSHGGRVHEPRDAFDGRLVVERPEWAEPASAVGVAI